MMSPKSRKWDQKIENKLSANFFRFSSFRLWPFHPTGINIVSKRPKLLLKHAEKQSEKRRVQSPEPVQLSPGLAFFGLNHDKIHNHDYIDYNHGLLIIIRLNEKQKKWPKT